MINAVIICALYVAILFMITKYYGVNYTEIIKSTKNIKNGVLIPVSIGSTILTLFAVGFEWIPGVFSIAQK